MDRQTALEQLKHIQEWLDADSAQAHRHPASGGCGCSGKKAALDIGGSAGNLSMPVVFQQLANAFRPALPGDAAARTERFASALILSATSVSRFAADLRLVGADLGGGREKFSDALAAQLDKAEMALRSAGAAFLKKPESAPATETVNAVAAAFHGISALLMEYPEGRNGGPFHVYGEIWYRIGLALNDFLTVQTERSTGSGSDLDIAARYENCLRITSEANAEVAGPFLFALAGNVARPPSACPSNCSSQGCTKYCYDFYSNPTGCGSWVHVSGTGWTITCTWTIDSYVKYVCCCYPNVWYRFWAYNDCGDCQITQTLTGTRTGTYTYTSPFRTQPAAPPTSFNLETSC